MSGGVELTVLFLDINGVLDSSDWYEAEHKRRFEATGVRRPLMDVIDPSAVAHLNRIMLETKAVIVISSSMRRNHTMQQLDKKLRDAGFNFMDRVIDITPVIPSGCRGDEIAAWMENARVAFFRVVRYVILDDDSDMLPEQLPFHVKTTNARGLQHADADRAIAILNNHNKKEV
jgi:hypothetical protein